MMVSNADLHFEAPVPAVSTVTSDIDDAVKVSALSASTLTAAVVALTAVALVLRWMYAFRSGIWRDEAQFLYIIQFPTLAAILQFLVHHESHPPLFYIFMHFWGRLIGWNETALFLPPILFGVAQIPMVYTIGERVFGKRVGLSVALLCAISAPLVSASGLLRPYSLLPFLTLVSIYFLWKAMYGPFANSRDLRRTWFLWALSIIAQLYTHNWAWFVFGAEWVLIAILLFLPASLSRFSTPRGLIARMWLLAQMLIAAVYLPWFRSFLGQVRVAGHGPTITQMPFLLFWSGVSNLLLPLPLGLGAYMLPGVLLLFLILCAMAKPRWGLAESDAVASTPHAASPSQELPSVPGLIVFAGVPLLALLFAWCSNSRAFVLLPRCETMLLPPALLAFCAILLYVTRRDAYRFTVLAAMTIGMSYHTLLGIDIPKTNVRKLAALVTQKAEPGDLVVIVPEQLASSFNYYYSGAQEQIDFPEHRQVHETSFDRWIARIGDPSRRNETYKDLIAAHAARRRIWLIVIASNLLDDIPQNDAAIPQKLMQSWFIVCVRASQIRDNLLQIYGKPAAVYCPGGGMSEENQEGMVALLFAAPVNHAPTRSGPRP